MVDRRKKSFSFSAATHTGLVRQNNQDAVAFDQTVLNGSQTKPFQQEMRNLEEPFFCTIADGLGGHGFGEVASEFAVSSLIKRQNEITTDADLRGRIELIHRELCIKNHGVPPSRAMGTTICGVKLRENVGTWFNVGDSRVYKIGPTSIEQLSIDDIPLREKSRRTSARITQCLGGSSREVQIDVHIGNFSITRGEVILLTSDGLTDGLSDQTLSNVCSSVDNKSIVETLLDMALEAGGEDNITVAAIIFT
jgi:PPM family protein phosphatase